uniref:Uncharacterized protein n=1 Tax=Rhizophora mucronata TaxID=61149 RepID=A0A2P2IHJ7_RHIMU
MFFTLFYFAWFKICYFLVTMVTSNHVMHQYCIAVSYHLICILLFLQLDNTFLIFIKFFEKLPEAD